MAKRVLVIAYAFPPVGGAGVQRITKFVKYLSGFGWTPSVLTVANPSVPVYDNSLLEDVPAGTIIRRAKSLEPRYAVKAAVSAAEGAVKGKANLSRRVVGRVLRGVSNAVLQPDPQVLWIPGAVREGKRLLREMRHEAIVATGPPFSTFLVGTLLSRRFKLPLVLDYRDEWTISNTYLENKRVGVISRCLQNRLQAWTLRSAKRVLATTRSSARALEAIRAKEGSKAQVTWIYNGFDPDDFRNKQTAGDTENSLFRIAYAGTLWNLTSAEPLVRAVQLLSRRQPALAEKLELVFAGRRTAAQDNILRGLDQLPSRVTTYPYLDHHGALQLICNASALCVLQSEVGGSERVVSAKIFEYMATGRPILGIVPRGEAWDLLSQYPLATLFRPRDVEGIANYLAQSLRSHYSTPSPPAENWDPSPFSRTNQARQLAEILDGLPQ